MSDVYQQHQKLAAGTKHFPFAILTLSDTRTPETDKGGQTLRSLLEETGHTVAHYAIVKDEPAEVRRALERCLADPNIALVITTGSTGVSKRDCAYEVMREVIERPLEGFGELFRMLSWEEIGSGAMMSRASAGVSRGKILFSIPGSTGAVKLALEKLILPEAAHLYWEINR